MSFSSLLTRTSRRPWVAPVLCGIAGLAYGILDWRYLDRLPASAPAVLAWLDEFVDLVWPVVMGIGIGLGVNLLRRHQRLNQQLSVENRQLERHVLTNALISQLLHEIRNPIHNLAAALEDDAEPASDQRRQLIRRNVEQLKRVTEQLSRWGAVYDSIDPVEPVALGPWLRAFIGNQVHARLRQLGVQYTQQVEPLTVHLHPLLLEQIFVTLTTNACEAMAGAAAPRRLTFTARSLPGGDAVEIAVANTGGAFPEEVLLAQGRSPVASQSGLGLGLLLVRKLLEQVGGTMALDNCEGQAIVRLRVAGGPA